MPELSHIKYSEDKYLYNKYVVYATLQSNDISNIRKHYEFCECTDLYLENITINSTFEKCDLSRSVFHFCYITKEAFFSGCNFTGVTFDLCTFETEEMYMFLRMVSKVKNCRVGEIK